MWSNLSQKSYARKRVVRGHSHSERNKRAQDSVIRELTELKSLFHRHLVKIKGSYTDKDHIAFLMEPVAECNLFQLLSKPGGLSGGDKHDIRTYFGCLASAVHYLHKSKIRHRDLSSRNVLIKNGCVYISDLGSAINWSSNGTRGSMTQDRHVPASLEYMAPEVVIRGTKRNSSSDMWSLGVVFLEMAALLVGRSLKQLNAAIEQKTKRDQEPFIWNNPQMVSSLISYLQQSNHGPQHDNEPLFWVRDLLDEVPANRPKSQMLMQYILDSPSFSIFCCIECQPEFRARDFEASTMMPIPEESNDTSDEVRDRVADLLQRDKPQHPMISARQTSSIENWITNMTSDIPEEQFRRIPGSFGEFHMENAVLSDPSQRLTLDTDDDSSSSVSLSDETATSSGSTIELDDLFADNERDPTIPIVRARPVQRMKKRQKSLDTGLGFLEYDSSSSGKSTKTLQAFIEIEDSSGSETGSDATVQGHASQPTNPSYSTALVSLTSESTHTKEIDWIQTLNELPEEQEEIVEGNKLLSLLEDESDEDSDTGSDLQLSTSHSVELYVSHTAQEKQLIISSTPMDVVVASNYEPTEPLAYHYPERLTIEDHATLADLSGAIVLSDTSEWASEATDQDQIKGRIEDAQGGSGRLIEGPPTTNTLGDTETTGLLEFPDTKAIIEKPENIALPSLPPPSIPAVTPAPTPAALPAAVPAAVPAAIPAPTPEVSSKEVPGTPDLESKTAQPQKKPSKSKKKTRKVQISKDVKETSSEKAIPMPKRFKSSKRIVEPGISASDYIENTWEAASTVATSVMSENTSRILKNLSFNKWLDHDHRLLERYCTSGNVQAVRLLLDKGCNPGRPKWSTEKQGRRIGPIMNAIQGRSLKHNKCVNALIAHGTDVNVVSNYTGRTPLHLAIENADFKGYEHLIRSLLDAGADTNKADKKDDRPLMKIFYGTDAAPLEPHRRKALALLLKEDTTEVNFVLPGTLNTPLHNAVRRKDPYAVGMLLHKKADVNAKNASGLTPLLLTANQFKHPLSNDHTILLRLLLESEGVSVNDKAGVNEQTALHYAVLAGSPVAVRLLLAHGADPGCRDSKGDNALALAREKLSERACEEGIDIVLQLSSVSSARPEVADMD